MKRFYAVDPMLEFASPYVYCGNDPVNFLDPDGKYEISNAFGFWLDNSAEGKF